MKKIFLIFILIICNTIVFAQKTNFKILPKNESGQDKSLTEFIENLKKSIQKKDTAALFALIDDSIVVSCGGNIRGKRDFSREWQLSNPAKCQLWKSLSWLINIGGTFEETEGDKYFSFPYFKSAKALGEITKPSGASEWYLDPYFTAVCVFPKTKVFSKPNLTSSQVGLLSYDVVTLTPNYQNKVFFKIETLDKKIKGYALIEQFGHLAGGTLIIKKNKSGTWLITSFAPYD